MQETDPSGTRVQPELPGRLEEGLPFDVTDRATDLDDDDIGALVGDRDHATLDFVGYVGNHLDGGAQVAALPLPLDDGLVDLAAGHVRKRREGVPGESLVVAYVEIGFGAVVGHEDLAVLIRAHRARVHVQIRVELEESDRVPL